MADSHTQVHEEVLFGDIIFKLHEVFGKGTSFIETHCGYRATLNQTLRVYAKYITNKIININNKNIKKNLILRLSIAIEIPTFKAAGKAGGIVVVIRSQTFNTIYSASNTS